MDYLSLFSLMQIITEMMPVSSSTHIFLISHIKKVSIIDFHAWLYFLHLCTVLVLAIYFFNRWKLFFIKKSLFIKGIYITTMVGCADVITFLIYFLIPKNPIFIFPGLIITSFILFTQGYIATTCNCSWNLTRAICLGFIQGIAFFPGISRLAITTGAARLLGFCTRHAFETAWMIAVPLFLGAGLVSAYDLYKEQFVVTKTLFITTIIATGISYYVIKWVHYMYLHNKWNFFGIYLSLFIVMLTFFLVF